MKDPDIKPDQDYIFYIIILNSYGISFLMNTDAKILNDMQPLDFNRTLNTAVAKQPQ